MLFRNSRRNNPIRSKIPGLYRILCIGDSLTFGQGVLPEETLPSRLGAELNRALRDAYVEVINESNCGYSFYDDWNAYIHRGRLHEPDLLVLILCDNDLEFRAAEGDYPEQVKRCWDEDGDVLPYFRIALGETGEYLRKEDQRAVIAYYGILHEEAEAKRAVILEAACTNAGIDFVNLLTEFKGLPYKTLIVGEHDAHPSPHAHMIASRRLARHIISRGYTPPDSEESTHEAELYGKLLNTTDEMRKAGYPTIEALGRLRDLLDAKRSSKKRLKLSDEKLIPDEDFNKLSGSINELMQSELTLLLLEAYAESLKLSGSNIASGSKLAENLLRTAEKNMFVLRKNLEHEELSYDPYAGDEDHMGSYAKHITAVLKGAELTGKALKDIEDLTVRLDAHSPVSYDGLEGISGEQGRRFCRLKQTIIYYLGEAALTLNGCRKVFREFTILAEKHQNTGLARDVSRLADAAINLIGYLNVDKIKLPAPSAGGKPGVMLTLRLRTLQKIEKEVVLNVNLNALVPHDPFYLDQYSLITDAEPHAYRFKLPVFTLGALRVSTTPLVEIELEEAVVYINEERSIRFTEETMSREGAGSLRTAVFLMSP